MRLDAQQPGRIGNIGRGLGWRTLALEHLEEHLGVAAGHVGVVSPSAGQ
jgi:hypothetical protein